MSTRSRIAQVLENGKVNSIYCHFDGYVEGVGSTLYHSYNTPEAVSDIIALGDISSLEDSIEAPEGHSFDTPVEGHTVAYGRDRHETGTEFFTHNSLQDLFSSNMVTYVDYVYVYKDGEWFVGNNPSSLKKLSTLIVNK